MDVRKSECTYCKGVVYYTTHDNGNMDIWDIENHYVDRGYCPKELDKNGCKS